MEKKLNQQTSKCVCVALAKFSLTLFIFFRVNTTVSELNEERQLGKALRSNQQQWQNKITKLEEKYHELKQVREKEVADLKEQVRDLMFFIDAQQIIEKSEDKEEIAGGTITVGEAPKTKAKKGKKKH